MMTFVLAQRFGDRIVIIADTAISNRKGVIRRQANTSQREDLIPGRLKTFPLRSHVSIGYAGCSDVALRVIRQLPAVFDTHASVMEVLNELQVASTDGKVDFLLVCHVDAPEIYKVARGSIASGQQVQWIGDGSIANYLQEAVEKTKNRYRLSLAQGGAEFPQQFGSVEEQFLLGGWADLLLTDPTFLGSVGGFPVALIASPFGHYFQNSAAAYNPGAIRIAPDGAVIDELGEPIDPADRQYSYAFVTGPRRGAAVLGVWLQNSGAGYVYDPLTTDRSSGLNIDQPSRHCPISLAQLHDLVARRAEALGGVLVD